MLSFDTVVELRRFNNRRQRLPPLTILWVTNSARKYCDYPKVIRSISSNMSLIRSPSKRSDSQPDLSRIDKTEFAVDPQITYRKRKQPDSECGLQHEISQLRVEMMTFLKDFSVTQIASMNKVRDDIMCQLKEQLSELQSTSARIIEEQSQIKSELKNIKKSTEADIRFLQESMNFHSEKQEENNTKLQVIKSEVAKIHSLEENTHMLQNKVEDLQFELNAQQQRDRNTNLEITGIPHKANEDLKDYLLKVSVIAKIQLAPHDIISINRVEPRTRHPGKPKVIVAKLASTLLRDSIISGIRRNRGLTTIDIGLAGEPRQIYVNEHLTPLNKMLYGKAREAAKKNGYRYVWVKYGRIFARKDDTHPPLYIRTTEDVNKIKSFTYNNPNTGG